MRHPVCVGLGSISIHALREEGDPFRLLLDAIIQVFLSTPSVRRATIRASNSRSVPTDFYPRPP